MGVQTKFNYAWGLIKSNRRTEQQLGVRLLTEIFRDYAERRRECLYYLALGHYRLGNYAEARKYNEILLENEPSNTQALSLRGLVDDKVAKGTGPSPIQCNRGADDAYYLRGAAGCCYRKWRCLDGWLGWEHAMEGIG